MDEFINLSIDDKKFVIEETALKYKLTPQIIEKDFWISYILKFLFNESKYKNYLTFKGGTSLSKVYDVIFRMSEDIDLILDWTILGVENNTPFMERSIRQQNKYNDYINNKTKEFIKNCIYEELVDRFKEIDNVKIDILMEKQIINIYYPRIYMDENKSILPCIRLEIGTLAAWTPAFKQTIKPLISIIYNKENIEIQNIRTISIERTFYEKITILHREANRPKTKQMPKRYARHYYDVYQIYNSKFIDEILNNIFLLKEVTFFKMKFYNDNWANYGDILKFNIKLIPDEYRINELMDDYKSMEEMIMGNKPSFIEIINTLLCLENLLCKLLSEELLEK